MAHLIVDDEEAERLAAAIAKETGQSLSAVVTEALRERAERLPKRRGKPDLEELLAAVDRISSRVKGPAIDHGQELYDEYGLPK